MAKVLVAVDDYSELVFLETLFKKVGLDVEAVQNDVAVPEKMLGFSPDLMIISAYGSRVNPIRLLSKIRRKDGYPRIIVLFQKGRPGAEKDLKGHVDAMLESPIHPRFLLEAAENLLGIESGSLMRKMERMDYSDKSEQIQHIKGDGKVETTKVSGSTRFPLRHPGIPFQEAPEKPDDIAEFHDKNAMTEEEIRRKQYRYDAWTDSEILPPFQGIGRERAAAYEKEWRKHENDPEIVDIDEERKAFARALFKKAEESED